MLLEEDKEIGFVTRLCNETDDNVFDVSEIRSWFHKVYRATIKNPGTRIICTFDPDE